MRATFFQMDISSESIAENIEKIDVVLFNVSSETDILVLPEMFLTGFVTSSLDAAIEMNSPHINKLRIMAMRYKVAIIGSLAVKDTDSTTQEPYYANRMFFISDSGNIETSDKRHLFKIGGEDKLYRAGTKRVVINYKGVRILPLVCYDLRFPVWSRIKEDDYDMIIYCASWPASRSYVWDTLLRARAIENQAYVIGVNRVGTDKEGIKYNGHSVALDYMGQPLSDKSSMQEWSDSNELFTLEMIHSVDIDTDVQKEFKKRFPVCLDADKFTIEL